MREGSKDVSSKGKVVGEAAFAIYETVAETLDALGEEITLDLINVQVKTKALNLVREQSKEKTGKKALRAKAFAAITSEEFASVCGDATRINALVEQKMALMTVEADNE